MFSVNVVEELDDGTGASFMLGEQEMKATASREIDYEGRDIEMSIYVNNIPSFMKGIYMVEVFSAQGRMGGGELLLR